MATYILMMIQSRKGMMHKKGKIQKIAKQNDSLGLEPDLSMDEVQWVVRQVQGTALSGLFMARVSVTPC